MKNAKPEKRKPQKSRMLRMLAHDVRNPISGILSASEFLLEDLPDAREEHVVLLQAIQFASVSILQLIDETLDSPTFKTGMLRLHMKPTDFVSLVRQDLLLNRPVAERKGVQVEFMTNGEGPPILIDPQKIYQVVDKLITNAIKSSYPDGRVEVRVGVEGGQAFFSVHDNGPGIPAKEQEAILGAPRKSGEKAAPRRSGPSSSLAVVTRIVEGHGGDLKVDSKAGEGSTFTVRLPVLTRAHSARPGSI
jgi:signal transduction histidine kinase